jgi:ATP-dependent exoDNAse (exonuclease V) beta subunit
VSDQPSLFDDVADDAVDAVDVVVDAAGAGTAAPVDAPLAGFVLDDDHATRRAIVERLDETMFVEAGAGSGKTKSLVDRIVALVTVAGVPMREIVAVTFTEKAASELRDRVRRELERVAVAGSVPERSDGGGERSVRAAAALDDLDGAAVSTLHAFAQRLLVEHPIEAGLPPRIEVLDDIASQVAFDERWSRFVDQLLDDRSLERPLLLALSSGTGLVVLRTIALACNANWDLVAQRMGPEPDPPPLEVAPIVSGATALVARAGDCRNASDRLAAGLAEIDDWARELRDAPDEYEQLRLLHDAMPKVGTRIGRKDNWKCDIDEVRAQLGALRTLVTETDTAMAVAAVRRLTWAIAQFTLTEAELRRRGGRLEFHDLLVLSRAVLRDPERGTEVRQRLRERYTRLLLDEFQDTDPIQCDLAVLLASGDPDAAGRPWSEVTTDPGRLFVVGDPKQSIYRFRRADIAAFLRMRETFATSPSGHGAGGSGASVHRLTRNFRSAPSVLGFVNHVFADLIVAEPDSQPEYVPLDPERVDEPASAAVVLLGAEPHADVVDPAGKARKPSAGELRDAEAADVAAAVRAALDDGWSVTRRTAEGNTVREPCRAGDIAVLLPARTSLGQLEDALDAAGIPYRAETSSLVYGTPEIRNLLLALRAVDDPTDELALVSALRSPLFGCGDDDLYTFRVEHGGQWNHQAPLPDALPADHPVGDAMRALAAWYEARLWLDASELLDRIVRERRVLEAAFVHGRPRDLWRRVRFVVDQARAFAEATAVGGAHGSSLRDFLAWADLQSAEGARVVETVLPETDDDAVRILTIHGAKGLEFPITIVSGMTTAARSRRNGVQLLFPHDRDTYALRVSSRVVTEEFERYEPIDEQMDFHEKLRLLYVGLTRARDHLVVSVHRTAREPDALDRTKWTHAELLWSAAESAPQWRPLDEVTSTRRPPGADAPAPAPASGSGPPAAIPAWDEWRAERDAVLHAAATPRVRSATAIAREAAAPAPPGHGADDPGLRKGARDLELPPWNKGRYGTAVGRAVHAVLQTVDLATGADVEPTAAAQAASEGVIGREADIAALARAAISSDVVRTAVATAYRREMYVAAPVGDRLLEGYVDLVYQADDGLVVVDYKTDAWHDDADLDAKLAHYRLQGASYAVAIEAATGTPVRECVFLFLRPGQAVARPVPDLRAAMDDVRAALEVSAAAARTP